MVRPWTFTENGGDERRCKMDRKRSLNPYIASEVRTLETEVNSGVTERTRKHQSLTGGLKSRTVLEI